MYSNLSHIYIYIQPDDNDDGNWNDEDMRLNSPNFNQSSMKNQSVQRRQTVDTAQVRQHLTPLKQLQAKFWPARQSHNIGSTDHEQMPMINVKQTKTIQQPSSARERNSNITNDSLNERKT